MAKFNERFRGLRQAAGLSQADLSKQIKISKSSINMYERGEREPSIEKLKAIADYFNVDMDYLTGKSEHKNKYAWLVDAVSNNGKDVDLTLVAYRIRSEQGISLNEAMELNTLTCWPEALLIPPQKKTARTDHNVRGDRKE